MIPRKVRIAAAWAVCLLSQSQTLSRQVAAGVQPMAVAVNEATNKAYVVNRGGNSVTVIDGRTGAVAATVRTGTGPEGIAVNPATNRIYVANAGDGSVTVIDGAIDAVVMTVRAGAYPQAVAVNPTTNRVYVANNYGHNVTVIDGATNTAVATVRVGQGPRAIVANPATNKVYTANYGSKDVTEIDGAGNQPVSLPVGKHPWALALDPRSNRVYCVNEDAASVSILDRSSGATREVRVGEIPFAVGVNPRSGAAYVLSYAEDAMTVIDGASGRLKRTVHLAAHPSAIGVDASSNRVYIASQTTGSVLVVNGESGDRVSTIRAGSIPYAIAIDESGGRVFVANLQSDDVTLIDGRAIAAMRPVPPLFRVVAMAESGGGGHQTFVDAAHRFLDRLAAENNFVVDYVSGTDRINETFLSQYQLFIQLNYPPYRWSPAAKQAFVDYITKGKGGWVGFHHAALLGEFDGYPMDPWFSQFLGEIRFTGYLPAFAKATVRIENRSHPLAKGLPSSFTIDREEWYTWSKSPRPEVDVLATVDESSYVPETRTKMGGDHPVIWSNPHYAARNVYIFMGHDEGLFMSPEFRQLFRNAVFWGAGR
ncbi:MAG: ThuA domain-containing protein [Acidobacteria bacterium]|nr:ThuA domain-containing protein [Acidobacteriota bacterium]